MEVSALRYSGGIGLHARSPLLRLQSDERLITLIRRGSAPAFEVLVSRYHARLLAFCRHLLGSREDAEDVLQEVFSAAFNAIVDDDRPINVRPWLYRIARNRSLNHLRRIQAVGVDSMDIHLSEHGVTTADKVHEREEFRLLVGDIQTLPETQRTALVLREMDALSYEQIAEAMETTVPSVKSLLVRARVSLAEAAQARMLTCEQVRLELGAVAEGLQRRPSALVRRHLRTCERCSTFKVQLGDTSKALAAVLPIGGFALLRKLAILHIGHSAGAGSGASGAASAGQAAAVGSTAAAGATAVIGSGSTGFISASVGAIASKAAAGLAAAALVGVGAVEVDHTARAPVHHNPPATQAASIPTPSPTTIASTPPPVHIVLHRPHVVTHPHKPAATTTSAATTAHKTPAKPIGKHPSAADGMGAGKTKAKAKTPPGRTQTQTDATVLRQPTTSTPTAATTTPAATSTPAVAPTAPAGCTNTSGDASTTPASGSTAPQSSADSPTTSTAATPTSTTSSGSGTTTSSCASDSAGGTTTGSGQSASSGGVAP